MMTSQAAGRATAGGAPRALGPLIAGSLAAVGAIIVATAAAWFGLGLPAGHVRDLARLLLISGAVSLAVTLLAAWLLRRTGSGLVFKLGLVCAIGPLVAAINTYYTADAMLIKQSDLGLLILLLTFSGAVGMAFALSLARTLGARVTRLVLAAQQIGTGHAGAEEGDDEIGVLGRTLNQVAVRLQDGERHRRELEDARRLLLAAVSHDLRTPLTSLRAVVEALDDGIAEDRTTTARYLTSARQQVRQLETLIEDLFELSRLDAGAIELHRSPLPVVALVEEAIESLRLEADRAAIRLETDVQSDLPPVLVDGQRIGRVLLNLLANALRFTAAGGEVLVRAVRHDESVCVSVRDSGTGIAGNDLPHIFEQFYRGEKSRSRQHGGAGLGLAIARGLVTAHGGTIWAESEIGSGTTISFTLPSAPDPIIGSAGGTDHRERPSHVH